MSEYELLDAWIFHMDLIQTYFVSYISATSAFLVVAHLASKELSITISNIAIALYSFTTLFFFGNFHRTFASAIEIREKMIEAQMTWYPAVSEPKWIAHTVVQLGLFVMIILSLVSIIYFISSRKKDDKNIRT